MTGCGVVLFFAKVSCGGVADGNISPETFLNDEIGAEGEGSLYTFGCDPEDDFRCNKSVAVLSPEVERFLLIGAPPLLGG